MVVMINKEVREYLNKIDNSSSRLKEHEISAKIRGFIGTQKERTLEDDAEIFAFSVYTDESNETAWNSYFGPIASFADKDGKPVDFPSLDTLSKETLDYWSHRLKNVNHAYFKARYADLLIEFKDYSESSVGPEIFVVAIDAHIALSKQEGLEGIYAKQELERAYFLAKKYKQKDKLQNIFDLSVSLESKIAQDDKPGLWGFTLEWFLLGSKISIPEDILDAYLESLEERRVRLLKQNSVWPLENATIGLARYYKFINDSSKAEAV
ncbi:hypothetical protein KC717_07105, partial [Candidatus Dojkabacteria bacterium]|nr:hypothetical protein [Candidatus Dojkabacteria bacterium]